MDTARRVEFIGLLIQQGRHVQAQQAARDWIAESPDVAQGHYLLALALESDSDPETREARLLLARAAALRAIELHEAPFTLRRLASIEHRLKNLLDAQHLAEDALELDPHDPLSHALVARYAAEAFDVERAREHYREALRLAPNEPDYLLGLLNLSHWYAEPQQARRDILAILALDPENADALAALAQVSHDAGDFAAAHELVLECLRLSPDHFQGQTLRTLLDVKQLSEDISDLSPAAAELGDATSALLKASPWFGRSQALSPEQLAERIATHAQFLAALPPDQSIVWKRICLFGEENEVQYLAGKVPNDEWRADFNRSGFRGVTLNREGLRISNWSSCVLEDCRFDEVDLSLTMGIHLKARTSAWTKCDLRRADWSDSEIEDCQFTGCQLERVEFDRAQLTRTSFSGSSAKDSTWLDAVLAECTFTRLDFSGAQLANAFFRACTFQDVTFAGADAVATFEDCTFS